MVLAGKMVGAGRVILLYSNFGCSCGGKGHPWPVEKGHMTHRFIDRQSSRSKAPQDSVALPSGIDAICPEGPEGCSSNMRGPVIYIYIYIHKYILYTHT